MRVRTYARVAEAALMLLVARALVATLPMRFWRKTLGTIRRSAGVPQPASSHKPGTVPPRLRNVSAAVESATARLPVHFRCLPRAMAVQWMARRRSIPTTLEIGLDRTATEPLHAWVDCGQVTVIGAYPGQRYARLLAIDSWASRDVRNPFQHEG